MQNLETVKFWNIGSTSDNVEIYLNFFKKDKEINSNNNKLIFVPNQPVSTSIVCATQKKT